MKWRTVRFQNHITTQSAYTHNRNTVPDDEGYYTLNVIVILVAITIVIIFPPTLFCNRNNNNMILRKFYKKLNSEKSEPQIRFEPMTLHDLVGCSNH